MSTPHSNKHATRLHAGIELIMYIFKNACVQCRTSVSAGGRD
jgi:hypothetical protein